MRFNIFRMIICERVQIISMHKCAKLITATKEGQIINFLNCRTVVAIVATLFWLSRQSQQCRDNHNIKAITKNDKCPIYTTFAQQQPHTKNHLGIKQIISQNKPTVSRVCTKIRHISIYLFAKDPNSKINRY